MYLTRSDHLIFSFHLLPALLCSVYGQSCKIRSYHKENDTYICDGWTSVPKNAPRSIELFDLSGNNIGTVDETSFQDLENLTVLKLQNNNLTYIDKKTFENNKKLVKVHLSENRLEILFDKLFIGNSELKCITLRRNFRLGSHISQLKNSFLVSKSLEEIDLSCCDITNLGENVFSGTPSLRTVDLSRNQIVYLDSKTISPLNTLNQFYLNWNPILTTNSCSFNNLREKYSNVVFMDSQQREKKNACMLSNVILAADDVIQTENITMDNKQIGKTTFQSSNISSANFEDTKSVKFDDNRVMLEIEIVTTEGESVIHNRTTTEESIIKSTLSSDNTVGGVDPLLIIIISNAHLLALIIIITIVALVLIRRRASKEVKPKLVCYRNSDLNPYEQINVHDYMVVSVPPEVPPRPSELIELTPENPYDAQGYMFPRQFVTCKYDQLNRIENNLLG